METIRIKKDSQFVSLKVRLRAEITKEDKDTYFSYCPALHVYSQGKTKTEAQKNLTEAIQAMIEVHLERDTFTKWMKERGFHMMPEKAAVRALSSKKPKKAAAIPPNTSIVNIPAEFPMAAYG